VNTVGYLLRVEFRRRWKGWAAAALLIGLAGATVLGAFAGAQRTASVITRSARSSNAEDLSFGPDIPSTPPAWNDVDALPGIATIGTARGLVAVPIVRGRPDFTWLNGLTVFPVDDRLLRSINRPQMLAGRLPRPDRQREVFIDETFARRHHLHVGQHILLQVLSGPELEAARSPADIPAGRGLDVLVTGVGRLRDEATRDPSDPQLPPEVIFTPAATARFAAIHDVSWDLKTVRLTRGAAGVPAFERRVRSLLHGVPVTVAERKSADARARRAMQPYVVTLLVFGVLAGVASIAVIGQLLGRQEAARRDNRRILQSMGLTRGRLAAVGAVEGCIIGGTGALLAIAGAIALSPLAPIGPLGRLEPDPGLAVDVHVLGIGAALIVGLTVLRLTVAASRPLTQPGPRRVNRGVEAVARTLAPSLGTGIRLATQGGSTTGSVPLRSTMIGLCTAIAAVSATLVYSAGLTHFVDTPRLFGWHWDALVAPDDGNSLPVARAAVARDPGVRRSTAGQFGQVIVRNTTIPAIGIAGSPNVEIVDGRRPTHADEIALGAASMRTAHTGVGRHVVVHGPGGAHRYLVTGTAVFPRLAPYPAAEPTGLGIGAAFTPTGLQRLVPNAQDQFILADLRTDPAHLDTARTALGRRIFTTQEPGQVLGPQRPNDVTSYDRVARTPLALAALLALLALATAAHVLITSVRRRRRELAVLKTLGFSRRQVSISVAAQATTMIGIAAVIGIPLGIVVGLWTWGSTATWLGIAVEQVVPLAALSAAVVTAIVLANGIAFVPGRLAARIQPSIALRAE
jgi:hypothetical protein